MKHASPRWRRFRATFLVLWVLLCLSGSYRIAPSQTVGNDDNAVAETLSAMLRSARSVISSLQNQINDPDVGDKGITGKTVLEDAAILFQQGTGVNPASIDPNSRRGRLLKLQMDAIAEVVDSNQATINKKGVAFKGFIPATFARLVNEAFAKRASAEAEVKVTAPDALIRNRKARPDAWEVEIINKQMMSANWPKGQVVSVVTTSRGKKAYRFALPEYYTPSCLVCHGGPKGEIDLTGYPKEGGSEGDLGGVISITLFHQ